MDFKKITLAGIPTQTPEAWIGLDVVAGRPGMGATATVRETPYVSNDS